MSSLICNIKNCNVDLKGLVYVTSCSHIFCLNHGATMLQKYKDNKLICAACNGELNKRDKNDCKLIDLNPSEKSKAMLLAGLNPEIISDISSKAFSFYMYQLNYRNQIKETAAKQSDKKNRDDLINMKASYDAEISKINQDKRDLIAEVNNLAIQREALYQKQMEDKREYRKLMETIQNYQRQRPFVDNTTVNVTYFDDAEYYRDSTRNIKRRKYNENSYYNTPGNLFKFEPRS